MIRSAALALVAALLLMLVTVGAAAAQPSCYTTTYAGQTFSSCPGAKAPIAGSSNLPYLSQIPSYATCAWYLGRLAAGSTGRVPLPPPPGPLTCTGVLPR